MPKKKIIVENIDDNDNKNDDVIDTSESIVTTIEKQEALMEKQEEVIETQQVETKPEPEPKPESKPEPEPVETQTRLQELIKCPKCNKMVKHKTLKYSHKKTCSGEESNQKKIVKEEPLPEKPAVVVNDIKETPIQEAPKLTRTKSIIPEKIQITPEMMKEHRQNMMKERLQLRQNNMKRLFANSIK